MTDGCQKECQGEFPQWIADFDVIYEDEKEQDLNEKYGAEFVNAIAGAESKKFVEGELFDGEVIRITDDFVIIDIGYKQEGLVYAKEFRNYDGSMKIKVGDTIEVYLERLESSLGNLVLSKDKAEIIKAWDRISNACEEGEALEGMVISKVKGGLSVDIGVKAFLPGSQIDIRPTRNLDKFIGKTMKFKVIKFNKKRGNIVLSRRAILQEERGKLREETLGAIQEGMIVKGIVKNITDYGAFIDLGGVDGLLHITDISWGRVKHPSNVISVGEEIEVKILKFDTEKERVSLGLKQVQPNPWESVITKYVPGTKVAGEVVSVKDYGAFLQLGEGIEGLVHVSEMSWTGKVKHPSKVVEVGDKLEAMVLDVDIENKRISLGLKQLQENPWDMLVAKYSVGSKVEGVVKSIVDFGLFIDLNEEVDALIHVSDIYWTKKSVDLNEKFAIGDKVKASVLSVDKDNSKFCLSIKHLEEDPWKRVEDRFLVGSVISAAVCRVTDFGAFITLEEESGIEGLIHISEMSEERVEKPQDVLKEGDEVRAMVISVDKESKKIALSMKAVGKEETDQSLKKINQIAGPRKVTLADKFKGIKVEEE